VLAILRQISGRTELVDREPSGSRGARSLWEEHL
jgi:hypothetical protein